MALLQSLKTVHFDSCELTQTGNSSAVGGSANRSVYDIDPVHDSIHEGEKAENGKYPSSTSAGSSPSGRLRTQGDLDSPSWRSNTEFVQHSRNSQAEDPFVSPTRVPERSSSVDPQTTPSHRVQVNTSTPVPNKQSDTPTQTSSFTPREDRVGQEISVDNAQAILPPNACVFVAK